jgi:hypothetical protein
MSFLPHLSGDEFPALRDYRAIEHSRFPERLTRSGMLGSRAAKIFQRDLTFARGDNEHPAEKLLEK